MSYRSWVVCRFYWTADTTKRVFDRAHKGLRTLGAVQLGETESEQVPIMGRKGATLLTYCETWRVEAQGRPLDEMRRLLRSFGINEVRYARNGIGRVLHGAGAGKEFNPCHSREQEAVYRQHKAYLETRLYRVTQAMRQEARDTLPLLTDHTCVAAQYLRNEAKINTPKPDYIASHLTAKLSRLVRLRRNLLLAWESEIIHASMQDIVERLLNRWAKEAKAIVEALSARS